MDCYARWRRIYSMQDYDWHGHRLEEIRLRMAQIPCLNADMKSPDQIHLTLHY